MIKNSGVADISKGSSGRIFGLDLMRSIAILLVVLSHTVYMISDTSYIVFVIKGCFGFYGVEVFFVLSGYLIGGILIRELRDKEASWVTISNFWKRRWFRTLPNYYLALVMNTILLFAFSGVFIFSDPRYLSYLLFGQNLVNRHPYFFPIAWSLSIEEWFYLLLPLWFLFFRRILKAKPSYVLLASIMFILVINLLRAIICYYGNPVWDSEVRKVVPLRLDSLMVGVIVGYGAVYYKAWLQQYRRHLAWGGVALTVASCLLFYMGFVLSNYQPVALHKVVIFPLTSIGFALFLPLAAFSSTSLGTTPWSKLFRSGITHISIISYSLYLFHDMVIAVLVNGFPTMPNNLLKFVLVWIIAIGLSTAVYFFYEKPMTTLRDRRHA